MSKKRYIDTKFWSDGYIEELDPIEKLLFLYLLTNERTNVAGVYELPRKIMSVETGIEKTMLDLIIDRFEKDDKIKTHKKWVRLVNSERHQNIKNNNIRIGIENVLKAVPTDVKRNLGMTLEDSSSDSNNLDLDSDLDSDLDLDLDLNKTSVLKEDKSSKKEKPVEKSYYDTVRQLDLPIRNHNNLRAKVTELEKELGTEDALKYLEFLREYYNNISDDDFKPRLNESLDIYAKRGAIRSWVEKLKKQEEDFVVI